MPTRANKSFLTNTIENASKRTQHDQRTQSTETGRNMIQGTEESHPRTGLPRQTARRTPIRHFNKELESQSKYLTGMLQNLRSAGTATPRPKGTTAKPYPQNGKEGAQPQKKQLPHAKDYHLDLEIRWNTVLKSICSPLFNSRSLSLSLFQQWRQLKRGEQMLFSTVFHLISRSRW